MMVLSMIQACYWMTSAIRIKPPSRIGTGSRFIIKSEMLIIDIRLIRLTKPTLKPSEKPSFATEPSISVTRAGPQIAFLRSTPLNKIAMLFATPIYLRVINDDNYDHTNLVRNNFTVGTENGVSWSSGDRLSIDGENATILASGSETATASLAGYSFSRSLRLDPITGELVATDCDSYLWNGDEYTASGDYIQVLTASNGCDSIVTLHLTINNSVHYSFTETATSPYIWNGTEYTETGDYTQNFTSANGCDSIVTLHLNILSGISQDGIAEISIYPNPATSTVSISCDNFYRATVIDMLGRIVMEVYDTTFDLSGLRPGEYIVKVSRITGEVEDLKLVKE